MRIVPMKHARMSEAFPLEGDTVIFCTNKGKRFLNDMLRTCCITGNSELVYYALRGGADPHFDNESPLINAVNYDHLRLVKLFLKLKANVHINDDEPLLSSLMYYKEFPMIKLLIEYYAYHYMYPDNVIDILVTSHGSTFIFDYFVSRYVQFQLISSFIIHSMVSNGRVGEAYLLMIELILSLSAMHRITMKNCHNLELIKKLYSLGVNLHFNNDELLQAASRNGDQSIVTCLCK